MSGDRNERRCGALFGVLLAANLALSLFRADAYPALFSAVGIAATAAPRALRKRGIASLPWPVTAVVGAVSFLHALGIVLSLYDLVWWWDILTHLLASATVAVLVALGLVAAEAHIPSLRFPPGAFSALVVSAVILTGVAWEVLEFSFDGLLGMHMQYSLDDTATDLSFDVLGGAMVALAAPFYLPRMRTGRGRPDPSP